MYGHHHLCSETGKDLFDQHGLEDVLIDFHTLLNENEEHVTGLLLILCDDAMLPRDAVNSLDYNTLILGVVEHPLIMQKVTLVKWNEPYQKLASCDSSGIIFVWIKYEGRWSIELINDRNTPVICFSWSHDGRMALICYQDGFVLVGSVTGQRYWSTLLPPDMNIVTSASWTPDDQQVYLGTSQGGLLILDIEGNTVANIVLKSGFPISDLVWSCEKFNMEEQQQKMAAENKLSGMLKTNGKSFVLAVCFKTGDIFLMRSYDDVVSQVIHTGLSQSVVDWSNSGELLAVAGKYKEYPCREDHSFIFVNFLHFYNDEGELIYRIRVPYDKCPVTSMTWGHNDKRLFLATGNQIHVAWISPNIASLQLLCRLKIHSTITHVNDVDLLPLPCRLRALLGILFTQTIKCYLPDPMDLRNFVITPPPVDGHGVRFYCTIIRHSSREEGANSSYTLFLEHMGGFLPLLKGKKISKIRPDFIIFDPHLNKELSETWKNISQSHYLKSRDDRSSSPSSASSGSVLNNESEDEAGSITTPRSRRRNRRRREPTPRYFGYVGNHEMDYANILPETSQIAEVVSNFWGTKFKLIGRHPKLIPLSLGQIMYKASLLHLQPRQMRLELVDLKDNATTQLSSSSRDNSYIGFSEDDYDDYDDDEEDTVKMTDDILTASIREKVAPVAPLPSRLSFCAHGSPSHPVSHHGGESNTVSAIVESSELAENYPPSPTAPSSKLLCDGAVPQSVKRTVIVPSSVGQIFRGNEVTLVDCQAVNHSIQNNRKMSTSPIKATRGSLRISVSCDNYLSEGVRWAAKAEDVMTPNEPELPKGLGISSPIETRPHLPLSCSANQLDSIVDILGAPTEILLQRDISKRLFLLGDKSKKRIRGRPPTRSRSCDEQDSHHHHHKSRHYCLSGHQNRPCRSCRIRDAELNREIFDIPTPPQVPEEEEEDELRDHELCCYESEPPHKGSSKKWRETCKIDAVLHLLEKARNVLTRNKNESSKKEAIDSCPKSPVHTRKNLSVPHAHLPQLSISSPSTPLPSRRNNNKQNPSFSPIRKRMSYSLENLWSRSSSTNSSGSILNSPLMKRKNRSNNGGRNHSGNSTITDSSEDEFGEEKNANPVENYSGGYRNLETFQKNKLKQKIKRFHYLNFNNSSSTNTNNDLNNAQESFKRDRTPSNTPDCSPFLSRKFPGRGDVSEAEEINRQHKRLKKLVLHNKSPMWNDFSQVYQLDFGGRVTQESAKNFQIEYKGKQVMQFGRIDGNAYTLDFQYPFSALQAFAVALANVTQRLK
nr:tubby-related protein 4-like [Lepeophtheirus salmonis]